MFDKAVEIILKKEGYLSDDPRDNGGLTKFGISKRAYPNLDIANLTVEQAIDIYRRDYWEAARCDRMPWPVALCVFDSAVNQGVRQATRMMQRALKIPDDGSIGPRTMAASTLASHNPKEFLARFMAARAVHYAGLSDFPTFGSGWMYRLFAVHHDAISTSNEDLKWPSP